MRLAEFANRRRPVELEAPPEAPDRPLPPWPGRVGARFAALAVDQASGDVVAYTFDRHGLVSGANGSGKSTYVATIIAGALLIGAEVNEQVIEMRARARDGPPPPA